MRESVLELRSVLPLLEVDVGSPPKGSDFTSNSVKVILLMSGSSVARREFWVWEWPKLLPMRMLYLMQSGFNAATETATSPTPASAAKPMLVQTNGPSAVGQHHCLVSRDCLG